MSEAKKAAVATAGSVSVGASSSHGSVQGSDRTKNRRPCHHSGGPQTSTKFVGKIMEMNLNIFDVGDVQGARLLSTPDELSEFVSRNNLKGH